MTQITKELYDRVLNAQTAEDLAAIALDMGVELSEEEVQSLYDRLHGDTVDSIPDDELSTIAGGNAVGDGWIFAEVHVGGPCLPGYNKMWGERLPSVHAEQREPSQGPLLARFQTLT